MKKLLALLLAAAFALSACVIMVPGDSGPTPTTEPTATEATAEDTPTPSPTAPPEDDFPSAADREAALRVVTEWFQEPGFRSFVTSGETVGGERCVRIDVTGLLPDGSAYPIDTFAIDVPGDKMFYLNRNGTFTEFFTSPWYACVNSPDDTMRAESVGMYEDGPSGLHQLETMRVYDLDADKVVWSAASFLSDSFSWSPDSRYLCAGYAGRTWRSADIVDTQTWTSIPLPGAQDVRAAANGLPAPDDVRPDEYVTLDRWNGDALALVELQYTSDDYDTVRVVYEYDVALLKLEILEIDD